MLKWVTMKTNALRVNDLMKRREPASRSLGDQLTALCLERGVMKKDLARKLSWDPSYLAQLFVRGMNAETIERLCVAFNALDKSGEPALTPFVFDRYVYLVYQVFMDDDPDLIRIARAVMSEWSEAKRELWTRTSLSMLGKVNGGTRPRRKP